ncbi:MAG TPA: ABC transporter permease [Usitatibacter sp.]|nr:ABC transporter permease [Usitatibacter sp.]HUL56294.1 ABC transporter permease [Usitatibacter sp.]
MSAGLRALWGRLSALLAKEFVQLLRDPRMRFTLVVPPLLQLFIFGYAATFDVRHADVAVVDFDRGPESRELLASIAATGHYTLRFEPSIEAASAMMDRGEIGVIVQLPARFAIERKVQLIADGSDPNTAQLVMAELAQVIGQFAATQARFVPAVGVEQRAWFNPNLEDRWFFVPGIMANVLFVSTMMLTAMMVVREREIGTLERLMVTPVGRLEFLVGKMVPVACVGLLDVALITAVGLAWFGVPLRGSVGALFVASALVLLSTQGLGLLVSSYAATQQQAMLSAMFFVMPMTVLSGFAFPIRNMPEGVQLLTWVDPLRYYLVVVRDIFLKGGGLLDHPFEFAMMALLGAAAIAVAAMRVR